MMRKQSDLTSLPALWPAWYTGTPAELHGLDHSAWSVPGADRNALARDLKAS